MKFFIKAYKYGMTFPIYTDNLKNKIVLNRYIDMHKCDGYHLLEIFQDMPRKNGEIGINRVLINTIRF